VPLLIDLKPGEKVIINGAVIENAGANTKIRICNDSTLLRHKEIMVEEEAKTPAARVYFCLQNAYIFPAKRAQYMALYSTYLTEFVDACPSAADIADQIRAEAEQGHYYKALKWAGKLLKHEGEIIHAMLKATEAVAAEVEAE